MRLELRWRSALWPFAFATVLAIAAWARLVRFRALFPQGEIAMLDGDSAYHLRQILETVRRFPHVPTFDAWMNWPDGGLCPWAAGFDLAGAAWVIGLGGNADSDRAKLLVALFPVVLGLLVVSATIALVRRLAGDQPEVRFVALAAGLLAAVTPQGVSTSLLGRSDHHVAETLSMVLLALWCLRALPGRETVPFTRRSSILWELTGAALVAGSLLVFTGANVYVALAAAPLLAHLVVRRDPMPLLGTGALALLLGAVLTGVANFPAIRVHGHVLSFMFPSLLQPLLVAAGGGVLLLCWAAPRLCQALRSSINLRIALTAAALVVTASSLAMLTPVRAGIHGWLLHQDPWIAIIGEFQPIWSPQMGRGLTLGLYYFFGSLGVAGALSLPMAAIASIRFDRIRGTTFTVFAFALAALTLYQSRFGRILVPFLAVATALALGASFRFMLHYLHGGARLTGVLALAATVVWCLADRRLRSQAVPPPVRATNTQQVAALDLRDAPPVSRGTAPGVLAPWDFGHDLEVLGGRPVVVNGFGSYMDAEAFAEVGAAYRLAVPELLEFMERRDLGFILAGPLVDKLQGRPPPFLTTPQGGVLDLDGLRASPLAPLDISGSGVPGARVRHLPCFLPRFASAEVVGGMAFPLPILWVYERVLGAKLRGIAPARTQVVAELPFHENGRPHVWKAWADADDAGHWELTVPVPSNFARPTLWTDTAWSVKAGGSVIRVEIPEDAVRRGLAIEVEVPRRR